MGFCADPNNILDPPAVERLFVLDEALATEVAEICALTGDTARDFVRDAVVLVLDEILAALEIDHG